MKNLQKLYKHSSPEVKNQEKKENKHHNNISQDEFVFKMNQIEKDLLKEKNYQILLNKKTLQQK